MKRIFSFAVAALLLTTSCSKESAVGIDNGNLGEGAALSFTFNVPLGSYTTYAIAEGTEWAVNTLSVYAYEVGGSRNGELVPITAADFDNAVGTIANSSDTDMIAMKESWVAQYGGRTVDFYFVGNDALRQGVHFRRSHSRCR